MVRNQFGVLDVELHSTHEAVLTPNTLRHLHKNPIAREHFTVTCTVTWLEKQVIAGLWDVPVLKTQTCNWNHSNSFHELFWRHTTHFAQPSYPRRSFFPPPPHSSRLHLHCCTWSESKSINSIKLMCPINFLPEVNGIIDWATCVDEKTRSFMWRCNTDECWASSVATSYQVVKHLAFGLEGEHP